MIRSVVGKSRTELRATWHEWRQECQDRRDRGEFIGCPQLNTLCGVIIISGAVGYTGVHRSWGVWRNALKILSLLLIVRESLLFYLV